MRSRQCEHFSDKEGGVQFWRFCADVFEIYTGMLGKASVLLSVRFDSSSSQPKVLKGYGIHSFPA